MGQSIITFIIVAFAVTLTMIRIIKYFRNPLKGCDGCEHHCQVCSLEVLKKEIEEKQTQNSNKSYL